MLDRLGYKITSFMEKELLEEFDSPLHLLDYLSRCGLSFAGTDRRDTVLRDLFVATAAIYDRLYGREFAPSEPERSRPCSPDSLSPEALRLLQGRRVVPATFHLIQYLGWKDDPTQQPQPKARGTGDLGSFIEEIVKDDPQVKDRIVYGVLGEEGTTEAQRKAEFDLKVRLGHTASTVAPQPTPEDLDASKH